MNRKKEILKMVKKVLVEKLNKPNPNVFLFGSQAGRKELKRADIDIGIDEPSKLNKEILQDINYQLNEVIPTLYTFDIIDFASVDTKFKEIAKQRIEPF